MMLGTRDIQVYRDLPEAARQGILALSVLIERIGTLPKADREDMFALLLEWRAAETEGDRRDVHRAMEEILLQAPIVIRSLPDASVGTPADQTWRQGIGEKVRELRVAAGLNQTQLAEKAGLTQSHVSRIENAELRPNHFTLAKIAKALGVEIGSVDPCFD